MYIDYHFIANKLGMTLHMTVLTIELVLDDVVEDLEEEEDKVVIGGAGEEEPGGGERLQEVEHLVGRHHGQALQVWGDYGAED